MAENGGFDAPERTVYQPFSQRQSGASLDEALFEGVPEHLDSPLRNWVEHALSDDLSRRVCLRLRLPQLSSDDLSLQVDDPTLLDVIDLTLWLGLSDIRELNPEYIHDGQRFRVIKAKSLRAQLESMLEDGGSAYRVNADRNGLESRVDSTVTEASRMARQSAARSGNQEAADLLRDAWVKAYGVKPDPGEAYADALKAVEALACPLFLPKDSQPTLGKVKSHLEQGGSRYELVIPGQDANPAPIDALTAMIGVLWHGQRERHAGGPTSAPISQEAAEAALHLAATLVQWLSTGVIRNK